jgi:hypothetical protein
VQLRIANRAVDLINLYDPAIDLQGNRQVMPASHVLRLSLFARTPWWMRAGDEIVLEDRLCASTRAIGSLEADGCEGVRLSIAPVDDIAPAEDGTLPALRLRARCAAVPGERVKDAQRDSRLARVGGVVTPSSTRPSQVAGTSVLPPAWIWTKVIPLLRTVVLLVGAVLRPRRHRGGHT